MNQALASTTNQFALATRGAGFAGKRFSNFLYKFARAQSGIIPNWAIDKDIIIERLEDLLPLGHMTPLNTAALLCALAVRHKHSGYDPFLFLNNFIKLYNADNFDRVCEIERIKENSDEWRELSSLNNTLGLDAVKIRLWAIDLEYATLGTVLGKAWGSHKSITVSETEKLIGTYKSHVSANDNPDLNEDPSAFPKEDYLPLLKPLREKGHISETQTIIILCFILHAKETRNDKKTSYITHPMAVANLVRKLGRHYFQNNDDVWMATLAALLHDGGEKTTLNVSEDLEGLLLRREVIDAIDALHKKDGETYFSYLERCASNKLACLVKLADIAHNSSDMGDAPSAKQAFVYPISAGYVEWRLKNPRKGISVRDYVLQKNICLPEQFEEINRISETNEKKKKATEFPLLQSVKDSLVSVNDLIQRVMTDANPRREEKAPVFT